MSNNIKAHSFIADEKGARLDRYVCERCKELSRTQIQKLITDGYITVNNHTAKAGLKLNVGDKVDITIPAMSKDAFERISGVSGSRDKVFRAIDLLHTTKYYQLKINYDNLTEIKSNLERRLIEIKKESS